MKRSSGPRKTASNLYQSIQQQLSVYAGAAVVAVVSVFVLTQPSEAKIVYTHANVVLTCTYGFHGHCVQTYHLDLNHDGVTDFTIEYNHYFDLRGCVSTYVTALSASGNGAIRSGGDAAALMQGAPIGHGQQFLGGERTMAFEEHSGFPFCSESHGGPWYNVTDRYLGLSFQFKGKTHYGWALLTVQLGLGPDYAKLAGYAYESIAGKSIIAGQTKGTADDPTNEDFGSGASLTNPIPDKPQPTSLGMLALGAQGVPLWRRKESLLESDLKGDLS